mgnify:CR=1 FL=1
MSKQAILTKIEEKAHETAEAIVRNAEADATNFRFRLRPDVCHYGSQSEIFIVLIATQNYAETVIRRLLERDVFVARSEKDRT